MINGEKGLQALAKLLGHVGAWTLPGEFRGPGEWLGGFYESLSLTPKERAVDLRVILNSEEFPKVQEFFAQAYSFNFRQELEEALDVLDSVS